MMKKLPKIVRAKKLGNKKLRLIATAADGNVGLYCRGTPKEEKSKYRILTRAGKMTKGMTGSGGYPLAPNDLKWIWKSAKKKRKRERRKKMASTALDPRAGRFGEEKPRKLLPLSSAVKCVECGKNTAKMSHAHTLSHPEKGYAQVFCCKHSLMMGYKCTLRRDARAKELAEKLLGDKNAVLIVGGTNGKKARTTDKHARDKTHKRRRTEASKRHRDSGHHDGQTSSRRRDSLRRRHETRRNR